MYSFSHRLRTSSFLVVVVVLAQTRRAATQPLIPYTLMRGYVNPAAFTTVGVSIAVQRKCRPAQWPLGQ
jgi:hypothetical protein